MKFSITIPLFNGAKFIANTLDSVLAQTYKDYEVILVNDGSPDNIGEVVREYMGAHPETRFIYVEQENRGLGGARNTAIKHASGDIIAILDQDDIWYPEKLERVAYIYRQSPEVDVVCHGQIVRRDGKVVRIFDPGPDNNIHRRLLFVDNMLSTSATTFRKAIIDEIGGFSEDRENFHFAEDYDLWLRMADKGYKFRFTGEILGEYSEHDSNFSHNLEVMLDSEINVLLKHYKSFKSKNLKDIYLMRRNLAVVYFRISRKYFRQKRALYGLGYLTRAFLQDPFFIVTYTPHYIEKLMRKRDPEISLGEEFRS